MDRSVVMMWIVLGALLLRGSGFIQKVAICGPREIRMVVGHTRTERGNRVTCWSSFPLQCVHRFESP
jgi:hypothetical protein